MEYFWLTVKHKWFVLLAGIRIGVPLYRLLVHDLSKFGRHEYRHYQTQFFGTEEEKNDIIQKERFSRAWLHHQNVNDHHWEYWIPRSGHNKSSNENPTPEPIRMSKDAAKEMLADWMGAGRAYEGKWPNVKNWAWLNANKDKIIIHDDTKKYLNRLIRQLGSEKKYFGDT